MKNYVCPLCGFLIDGYFFQDRKRFYCQCAQCELVFVPPEFHLNSGEEKHEYDLHCNVDEPNYREFLRRLYNPVSALLDVNSSGLDFGCGPGPVLAKMFREDGHSVDLFDKFYFPDETVFEKQYNFITATEVFEHLQNPHQVMERLWSCLCKGGILALMTKLVKNQLSFSTWHYKTDPTHIIFFSEKTFLFLANDFKADVDFVGNDVIIFRKKS